MLEDSKGSASDPITTTSIFKQVWHFLVANVIRPTVQITVPRITGTKTLSETNSLWLTLRLLGLNSLIMVLCVVVGLWSQYNEPGRYFREGRLITWISTFQLIAVGYICERIYQITRASRTFSFKDSSSLWRFGAVSFYFLAFDEIMKVHEAIDRYSHKLVGVKPTSATDHFDDLILLAYGIVGIFFVFYYWREVPRYLGSTGFALFAFIASAISIWLDYLSGDRQAIVNVFGSPSHLNWYMTWLGLAEEFFKIYAEVFFIGTALYCFHIAYRKPTTFPVSS